MTFVLSILFSILEMARSGGPSEDQIRSSWPLHWMVWRDDHVALKRLLREPEETQVSCKPAARH